ncbi:SH3 domain-containing protein Dlish-like [Artemia franciscana]|uniref:SH3 domain-containing protein n=1 Tax=Artemia franciscana TaxID=6661 RepID=A0AA88HWG5_ARTSF|nr:hypothetical protein QYM36_010172 [Artemia franciscana]
MAFLCPVRIRRAKKKKDEKDLSRAPVLGRITGSSSVETLVRVGLEKEHGLAPDSKMIVLHDFTPCVDDELEVKRGNIVNVLYQENDWVYVIADNGKEGFIPQTYCTPYTSHVGDLAFTVKKKLPRDPAASEGGTPDLDPGSLSAPAEATPMIATTSVPASPISHGSGGFSSNGALFNMESMKQALPIGNQLYQPDMHPFFKERSGRFVVLYTFLARDENDVSVERGELVTILNREDPDWFWILRDNGQEGFVPSAFVYPADALQAQIAHSQVPLSASVANPQNPAPHQMSQQQQDDPRCSGTELIMLYDYKAQASDDLSLRRGDWVYADLSNQTMDGWLWAYSPKLRKSGFIPKAYARPPAMTSL